MGALLDVLGALLIGTMLLLMMITFQFQLQDTAQRALYTASMVDHMDNAAVKLNGVIALAGIGYPPTSTVVTAAANRLVFNTYWNYDLNMITPMPVTIEIALSSTETGVGKALTIRQNGELLNDLGYILWVESLAFKYYTRLDALTTTASAVRSAEAWLTFKRDSLTQGGPPLRTRLQVKCFFMNAYMRGA
ncbi:MAG: hypothetical protein U1C33_06785 [Candidatus Cloacimonadaceae bacterium]|nr:hypothetical protein [Candidatus Cloacimonadaceae bacterium]